MFGKKELVYNYGVPLLIVGILSAILFSFMFFERKIQEPPYSTQAESKMKTSDSATPSSPKEEITESAGHTRAPLPSKNEISNLPPDGGEEFNRLIFEESPYLLQHARNPVNWYPWGEEAFEQAQKEDKPVFLSIGYSTCHWCHVMERESFENEEVARLMNKHFICVKVDREERPDLDQVYMTVTQAMTGSGGWPMTVILTPEKKPFFAATYIPRESRFGRAGMLDLLPQIAQVWKNRRDDVLQSANQITSVLDQHVTGQSPGALPDGIIQTAYSALEERFDEMHGGFGNAPKFPSPHDFTFLLRYWKQTGNERALDMVVHTLTEMRLGGIYDHVGFGFHRYSTDREWLLPHFEKMLYDQALISIAYLEAYQATDIQLFSQTVEEIFTYILRDMTSPKGGFYSAEDADSEGEEGKFYIWPIDEIKKVLTPEEAKLAIKVFNLKEEGNFREESTGERTGQNILHLEKWYNELSNTMDISNEVLEKRIEAIRDKLFEAREKRIHPYKDDKILTDWNGLMIAALATGGRILQNESYTKAAQKAADFVLTHLQKDNGRLMKRYRKGEAGLTAHLEDYAFLVWGLLELYETTFDPSYLEEAIRLNQDMMTHFKDNKNGGFYLTADDSEKLLMRPKESHDGAMPSGNSVAALNLLRISKFTGDTELEAKADRLFKAFSSALQQAPTAHTQMLNALNFAKGPSYEVVISGKPSSEDTKNMLFALWEQYSPNKVVILRPESEDSPLISQLAPYTKPQRSINNQATAYVCQNFTCELPTNDIQQMLSFLKE